MQLLVMQVRALTLRVNLRSGMIFPEDRGPEHPLCGSDLSVLNTSTDFVSWDGQLVFLP